MVAVNLIPVLSVSFFPTLDGPAHLYNADLIKEIIFSGESLAQNFYQLQSEPVPNWTGHLILLLLGLIFNPQITQKIFLSLLVIALPLIFRKLLKTAGSGYRWYSWLIFPFCYSFVFYLGFYNFLLGVIFMFISLNFRLNNIGKELNFKQAVQYFALFFLTYFSHIFVFALMLCGIAIQELVHLLMSLPKDKEKKLVIKSSLTNALKLLVIALPFLILLLNYFRARPPIGEPVYLSYSELSDWIKNIRPIIALHFQIEEVFTKKLFYLISALSVVGIYELSRIKKENKENFADLFKKIKPAESFLIMAALFLFLYYYLPDSDGNAGFVSVRLGLLFYLFLVLWISAQPLPTLLGVLTAGISVYCILSLNQYYLQENKIKAEKIEDMMAAKKLIKPNSLLLPLNFEEDWLLGHSPNFLGINNGVIVLENYEASTSYFPLKWKEENFPGLKLNSEPLTQYPCIGSKNNPAGKPINIDYIYKMGMKRDTLNECENQFFNQVGKEYNLKFQGRNGMLWERKNLGR